MMKKSLIIIVICFFTCLNLNGQPVLGTDYSYSKIGNNYTFSLTTYFSFGSGGGCPWIKWVIENKSNDTMYIKALYDVRGIWSSFGCSRKEFIKYTNLFSDINYFNVSTNTFDYYLDEFHTDTTWNLYDTTFYIGTSSIKEQNAIKALVIYPNPTSTSISLSIAANELLVYNSYGQVVLQSKDIVAQQSIPVSQLNSGLYFVAVFDKEKNEIGVGKFYKE